MDTSVSEAKLVTIQKGGAKPPLFCIYGILLYYELAKHLGPDQPVYGVYSKEEVEEIKAKNEGQSTAKSISIPELAARYLVAIRQRQPEGPYYLAGECFGGVVALEIAHQLRAQGQKVNLLCLLDTPVPGHISLPWSYRIASFARDAWQNGLRSLIGKAKTEKQTRPGAHFGIMLSEFGGAALQKYHPQPYQGATVLFRATNTTYYGLLDQWNRLAVGKFTIRDIPGDHLEILKDPHVRTLARELRTCLDQAVKV